MYNFFDGLMDNPYIWAALSFITVASILLSIYFGLKSIPKKKFLSAYREQTIVSKQMPLLDKLTVLYDHKPIDTLSVTRFCIWNAGNATINYSDLAKNNPLYISSADDSCKIIECQLISITDASNNATCLLSENQIDITFDYFDSMDGVLLEIIHTGSPIQIITSATIKGCKKI